MQYNAFLLAPSLEPQHILSSRTRKQSLGDLETRKDLGRASVQGSRGSRAEDAHETSVVGHNETTRLLRSSQQ